MIYNTAKEKDRYALDVAIHKVKMDGGIYELTNIKEKRSNLQNRSRWLYLGMVADILNEQGQVFVIDSTEMYTSFTKDLLYEVYWQTMRRTMYPNKKRQLNTKEFCDLVDNVIELFARIFEISIPFPNIDDFLLKLNHGK